MTRETRYTIVDASGNRLRPWRSYTGQPCSDIDTSLPNWHWEPLDRRLEASGGVFSLSHLRAWLSDLPRFQPPARLLDVVRFVDGLGHCMDPELALRLFLEALIAEMADVPGAAAVHVVHN
jgi:hypothetical protein